MKLHILGMSAGVAVAVSLAGGAISQAQPPKPAATFLPDGRMAFPSDYRTWVYLSSGMDMAYGENAGPTNAHVFDNVFVDRVAYAHFEKSGRWPEGAVFVLEIRGAAAEGSINKRGHFQTNRLATELHVKDKRFKSGWAFFAFRGEGPGIEFPQTSDCNACHEKHGASDTTFVQFYPTLLPIARANGTLDTTYLATENAAVK
ncbi:cytochrome P460 family protein [uncultured Phenylobacterium sp.]|uniref:cytochrome P460 family protein n=1 Tax=uncultured Phenylobacterium sp. TaxID=349273 RepID=UPI0025EB82CD|nr:cytochrome P460 family protein [uncultured Phenylobacterium sp.]